LRGCRARALVYTKDLIAGDPGCIYNLHEWEEISEQAFRFDESEAEGKRRCKKKESHLAGASGCPLCGITDPFIFCLPKKGRPQLLFLWFSRLVGEWLKGERDYVLQRKF